ncbi:MAG: hypothetical protein OEY99_06535 [Aigarchaeota archaeon]|nr:hypothetical protein [Aigarchaeota archaeon]
MRQEEATISGRVHAEELHGDNEVVVLSFDGQEIGTMNTGEDGSFTFNYVVPRTQELGEVQLGYRLESNSFTTSQQSEVYARTQIGLEAPDSVSVKKLFNIKALLTDDLGSPMGNAGLTLESEEIGQVMNITTEADGTKEIPLKIEKVPSTESVSYMVSYRGSGYYLDSTSSVSVRVARPIMPKLDVITTVTIALIFSVLCLVGYTVFTIMRRRLRRGKWDEPVEILEEKEELGPEGKRPVAGIIRSDERLLFQFPQIIDPFPLVWGIEEELVVRLGLSGDGGAPGESADVQLIVDDVEGPVYKLTVDHSIDHLLTFDEKCYHRIKALFVDCDALEATCEAVIKIVDYREEVNDLFNEEFEGYRSVKEEIKTHFTAREFMHTILRGLSEKFRDPLNEMVTVFEIADYSLHDIRRREYERFYSARNEFEGMKFGK